MTTTSPVRLTRDGSGGYTASAGRWTLEPVTMGAGVSHARAGGWSNGRRCWLLTDTTGAASIGYAGRCEKVLDRLWEARDLIAAVEARETV